MTQRLSELWIILKAEKRKSLALAGLVLIALVMWARTAVTGSGASVERASGASSANAGQASQSRVGRPAGPSSGSQQQAGGPSHSPATPVVNVPKSQTLDRDLFALRSKRLALPVQPEPQRDDQPKSTDETDDNPEELQRLRRQALIRKVSDQAAGLRLRSTMIGANPIAVIESADSGDASRVLRVGESVADFELVEVRAQSVVLQKSGVRVVLSREREP